MIPPSVSYPNAKRKFLDFFKIRLTKKALLEHSRGAFCRYMFIFSWFQVSSESSLKPQDPQAVGQASVVVILMVNNLHVGHEAEYYGGG